MLSETELYNLALSKISAKPLISTDPVNDTATTCARFYPIVRDSLLRLHSWRFAIKRMALSRNALTPAFGYLYSHTLPVDPVCLTVLATESNDDWSVEGNYLLSDNQTEKIIFIASITDISLFDSLFVDALTTKMAAEIAFSITGSQSIADSLSKMALIKIREAIGADKAELRHRYSSSRVLYEIRR